MSDGEITIPVHPCQAIEMKKARVVELMIESEGFCEQPTKRCEANCSERSKPGYQRRCHCGWEPCGKKLDWHGARHAMPSLQRLSDDRVHGDEFWSCIACLGCQTEGVKRYASLCNGCVGCRGEDAGFRYVAVMAG